MPSCTLRSSFVVVFDHSLYVHLPPLPLTTMKSLLRAVPKAPHVCPSCRRTFTSIAPRQQDRLAELDSLLSGRAPTPSQAPPKPTATLTESPPSRSPSQSSRLFQSMRNSLQKAQAQTPAEPEQLNMGTALGGALSGMSQDEAIQQVERQQHRRWVSGDVYSVHDLGPREGQKWAELKRRPQRDVFEMIGEDPRRHYKVRCPSLLSFQ